MAEYGREQGNQLSRVIENSGVGSRQFKRFVDNRCYFDKQTKNVSQFWTKSGVDGVVISANDTGITEGVNAINELNSQDYEVQRVEKKTIKRHFTNPFRKDRNLEVLGWHNRANKIIAVCDLLNNEDASSTLVHEVAHAKQAKENEDAVSEKKPYPDTLSKEIDAHIKQEEYNIKMRFPPKNESLRKADGEIDIPGIEKYVKDVYSVGFFAPWYKDTVTGGDIIERIKPWNLECPIHLEGEGIE
nr:MAG TPA: PolyVal Metallopeptidase superfamily domain [Caudoviricetes sp.]